MGIAVCLSCGRLNIRSIRGMIRRVCPVTVDVAEPRHFRRGRANFINFYARLLNGDAAYHHLVRLLSGSADDNLLTCSRVGVAGATQNIFAIDGNTAGATGIAEMLLQSHGPEIHLLPALPSAWPEAFKCRKQPSLSIWAGIGSCRSLLNRNRAKKPVSRVRIPLLSLQETSR